MARRGRPRCAAADRTPRPGRAAACLLAFFLALAPSRADPEPAGAPGRAGPVAEAGDLVSLGLFDAALSRLAGEEGGDVGRVRAAALAGLADEAYFFEDYAGAIALYGRAEAADPGRGLTAARTSARLYARLRLADGAGGMPPEELASLAEQLFPTDEAFSEAWFRMGRGREAAEDLRGALTAYRRAAHVADIDDDPAGLPHARDLAERSRRRPLGVFGDWPPPPEVPATSPADCLLEVGPFVVTHQAPEAAGALALALRCWESEAFRRLGDAGRFEPPFEIVIQPTREAFIASVGDRWASFTGYARGAAHIETFHQDGLLTRTLPHELTHAACARLHLLAPTWVLEGLAVRAERSPTRFLRYIEVDDALEGGQAMALADLLAVEDVADLAAHGRHHAFYDQATTLVDFLVERRGGIRRFSRFVEHVGERALARARREAREAGRDAARDGPPGEPVPDVVVRVMPEDAREALRQDYGIDGVDALDRAWRTYVREIVRGPE